MAPNIGISTASVNGYLTGRDIRAAPPFFGAMLSEVLERVERRLKVVGLTASAASARAGLSKDAIRNLKRARENDARQGVSTRTITALAPVLETTVAFLMEGSGPESVGPKRMVPIVGYVGAGAEAHLFSEGQGPFGEVEAPDGSTDDTVSVEVRGESLGALFNEWLVFYDNVQSPVRPALHGKLCVVGLPDGRVLVKQIKPAGNDRFHLISNTEGPLLDQEVDWAAKVMTMTPR